MYRNTCQGKHTGIARIMIRPDLARSSRQKVKVKLTQAEASLVRRFASVAKRMRLVDRLHVSAEIRNR